MMRRLLLEALGRRATERRPLWIMRQAGRYLPEYRRLRGRHSFRELAADPELATQVTLMPLQRFPLDAAIVFADIMSPLAALGVDFDFDPGPVVTNPIRSSADIRRLRRPAAEEIAPEVMEAIRMSRRALPEGTAVIGFCGAPWTLAAYLVEGRSVKDFPALRAFAVAHPEALHELLERLSAAMADYLIMQARAGADAVQIFDSWAGLLPLAGWRRVVRPHLERLLQTVGAAGVPRILFLQNAPHLVEEYARLPAEAIGVDWRVDLAELQARHGSRRALQGNLDPAVLLAGPEATRAAAETLLAAVAPAGHIVNLGHGILPATPLASIDALVDAVHAETVQGDRS